MDKPREKQHIVRVEGIANSYGIGEVVAPGCTLFYKGMYNLSRDEAEKQAQRLKITFPYTLQFAK